MQMLTEKVVTVLVFVFKSGIGSMFGHDLKLRAKSLTCMLTPAADGTFSVEAVVDARRIEVECARSNGHDLPATALSPSDRQEIHRHILYDVLNTERFHEIHFSSTRVVKGDDHFSITGNLTMTGHTHQVHFRAMKADGHYVGTVHINQPDFGIKPFSAALGALKIKPEVQVEVAVPLSAFEAGGSQKREPPMP
jgi:hypothetical protein